jgi:hypothetical protein
MEVTAKLLVGSANVDADQAEVEVVSSSASGRKAQGR